MRVYINTFFEGVYINILYSTEVLHSIGSKLKARILSYLFHVHT
jgi:hypothetical protein